MKLPGVLQAFLLPVILAACLPAAAQTGRSLSITESPRGQNLEPHTAYLRDPGGQLTYEDITKPPIGQQFEYPGAQGLNFGFTRDSIWYRLKLTNASDAQVSEWVVEVAWPLLDYLDMFVQRHGTLDEHLVSGDLRPPGASGIKHRNLCFPVRIEPGETITLYFKGQSEGAHQLPIKLWSQAQFFDKTTSGNLALGMFYGVIGIMVIYNLLIYLGVRDRVYPYYLLLLMSIAGVLMSLDGFQHTLLWDIAPGLINGSVAMLVATAMLAMLMFVRVSLDTALYTPRLDKLLRASVALASLGIVAPLWVPITEITFINVIMAALMTLITATVVIVQVHDGRRLARFYGVVWATLLIGVFAKILQVNALLPVTFLTTYSVHIGVCVLVTLLSLALVDQINTQRREAARLMQEKAEAESSARNAILGRMSHELRTPMNAIVGFTDLAQRESVESKRRDYLRHIKRASNNLLKLINDVLDYSRFEAGDLKLEPATYSLKSLILKVIEELKDEADKKELPLKLDFDSRIPAMLVGDSVRLEQVLQALLDNAIKFTAEGEVGIKAALLRQPPGKCEIEFTIYDTGIGMSTDQQAVLNTPLAQVDESMTRAQTGIGIGLTLSRRLIELMGGELQVHSVAGRSSTFSFSILQQTVVQEPETNVIEASSEQSSTGLKAHLSGLQVLLVEDNPLNRNLADEILSDFGILLDTAQDGAEAVERAQHKAYDLIFMDLQMPVMDGLEASRRIRTLPDSSAVPIIAMTANTTPQDRADATAAGMNDFLPKPIDIRQIKRVLERWAPKERGTYNAEEFRTKLQALATCIGMRDFQSRNLCEALRPTLEENFGQERIATLIKLLADFDYEQAHGLIQNLLEER